MTNEYNEILRLFSPNIRETPFSQSIGPFKRYTDATDFVVGRLCSSYVDLECPKINKVLLQSLIDKISENKIIKNTDICNKFYVSKSRAVSYLRVDKKHSIFLGYLVRKGELNKYFDIRPTEIIKSEMHFAKYLSHDK